MVLFDFKTLEDFEVTFSIKLSYPLFQGENHFIFSQSMSHS